MKRTIILAVLITLGASSASVHAQVIEDALRLAQPPSSLVSARSAGMGNAFTGLANDASALYWNPAGLGQLRLQEFSLGLANVGMNNDAMMFNVTTSADNSSTALSNVNLAVPFPVVRGAFVMAGGYNRLRDYSGAMAVDVYNPQSSIQASLFNAEDETLDFAWNLGLEDTLVLNYLDQGQPGWLAIPVANRVQQTIDRSEEGSLNQWSVGGAMEVAPRMMVGVALNVLSGSYRFERQFIERDINNVWQGGIVGIPATDDGPYIERNDFQRLELREEYEQDLAGWNMKFGFLYNLRDKLRFGVSIQTASYISISEDYFKSGDSEFADAVLGYDLTFENHNYDVITPAVYTIGASWSPVEYGTVSADFEFVDFADLEFGDSNDFDPVGLNRDIRDQLRATNNFRLGAEVNIPETGLFLRGGFGYRFSPWEADEGRSEYNIVTLSGGLGYQFEHNFSVEAAYAMTNYETFTVNYVDPDLDVPESAFRSEQEISISNLMLGIVYRF